VARSDFIYYKERKLKTPYIHTEVVHNLTAPRVIAPIVIDLIHPRSVLDVGCGLGTWLKAFEECGVHDCLGVDGDYIDRSMLTIPVERFQSHDLTKKLSLGRKFDLVMSLEVAEHLPEQAADIFVESLARHGDTHLFSAAIPGQGGQNHVNEQWPVYWEEKFRRHGLYFYDVIRPVVWNSEQVDIWYKQNIFLVKKEKPPHATARMLSLVHPELYELKLRNEKAFYQSLLAGAQGMRVSSAIFFNAIRYKIKRLVGLK
jgi:SAM-dependent methyltransferase